MASKLQLGYVPVSTGIDITIRTLTGLVWNVTTQLFETWADANYSLYVIAAEYLKGNMWDVQWPVTMPSSTDYMFLTTIRKGVSGPALDDHYLSGGNIAWDKDTQILSMGGTGTGSGGSGGPPVNIIHDTTQIINSS